MTYAVINSNNLIINVIIWDGQTSWQPPEDCIVVNIPENISVKIGDTYVDGQFLSSVNLEETL